MDNQSCNKEQLAQLRHSAAHLLAHAVLEMYPDTLLTIGPATQDGFFYDMTGSHSFKLEDLEGIQKKMHEISKRNLVITHEQMPKEQARPLFEGNIFKQELIDGIPGDTVGISRQGDFVDLCRGGHVERTGDIKYFKLEAISGSYWRADKDGAPLQRISGTAFFSQEALDEFLKLREEAKLYDHRRLGKQLDLFSFQEEGVGFPFFHPKGKLIINTMIAYLRKKQIEYGYQEISTPLLLADDLWKRSGHYEHYKDNMYFTMIDDKSYAIRPMNCPGSFLVYNERPRSYRELPLRLSEFGLVHRHELSGVLHGLMRVRAFTQDDAHIFCTKEQLKAIILETIKLTHEVLARYSFHAIKVALSTKPANAMGDDALWDVAIDALKTALVDADIEFVIQEGEGAFYGPKIEFKILDSMKREWQCGTIQVDFFQSYNFDMKYVSNEGAREHLVVVHRAIYGSLERFLAVLLEHCKGHLPLWLAPVQAVVMTITDEQLPYAHTVAESLRLHGMRVEIDQSSDKISAKIKAAQLAKVPWMIVLGKKEVESHTVTLRYSDGAQEADLTIAALLGKAGREGVEITPLS